MRALEEARSAALAAGAFARVLRCIELQGRLIGLWRSEAAPERTLDASPSTGPYAGPPVSL